jgi:WD40 repeat protein
MESISGNKGTCVKIFHGHTSDVFSVIFNLDGQTLVSAAQDSTVRFWDVSIGVCVRTLQGQHQPHHQKCDVTWQTKTIAVGKLGI